MEEERKPLTFLVRTAVIDCHNCQLCYGKDMLPTFCQEFSFEMTEEKRKRALNCIFFIPKPSIVDRYNFHSTAPESERWYEGDW